MVGRNVLGLELSLRVKLIRRLYPNDLRAVVAARKLLSRKKRLYCLKTRSRDPGILELRLTHAYKAADNLCCAINARLFSAFILWENAQNFIKY